MPSKTQKVERVDFLAKKLSSSKGVYLTDFTGMDVDTVSLLRRKLKEVDAEYLVVKNTLARLAAKQEGLDLLTPHFEGPTGLAIANKDELSPARILAAFRREHDTPRLKLALVEGTIVGEKQIGVLAGLPAKDVLFGQVAGALKKPMFVLGFYLQTAVRQLLVGLDSLAKKKEAAGPETGVQETKQETKNESDASNSQSQPPEVKDDTSEQN
ncbi:MAG: 50S ribosomal protein L10 [Candidatus Eisenbacteria bacterium]|nr:50S ribosomal protein L10 [Candidatus Eisenbacteria bacterium]